MGKITVCKICECEAEDNWCPECEEHCELKEVDDRTCHLCGTHTVDKWCDNETCAEYIRDERIANEN